MPPSHAGNPKPGWEKQFNRHYMAQHYVVDYTKQYDNLLLSYGEHSQVQRYTNGMELISKDFLALDDHDNGWIPPGTDTAYKERWDSLFYLHDDLGTTTKVVGINGKTSAYYYDEFGRPLGAVKLDPNWSGPDNAIAYTGYTYDYFAELYYAQARYYLPDIGRFISQDPWAGDLTQPGTLNPYPYVLNNPLKYVDSLGLEHLAEGVSELTRQYRKVNTPANNGSGGTETNSWSCPIVEDLQRGLQQAGSGFVTGIKQINRGNFLRSYNVAKEHLPKGAKIYVIEGLIGEENYYVLTDGQLTSEDVLATAGAGNGIIFMRAKVPGGKILAKGTGKAVRMTSKEATEAAQKLGYRKTNYTSHGQPVFKK